LKGRGVVPREIAKKDVSSSGFSSHDTKQILNHLLPKVKRPTGFRKFTNSKDFQEMSLPGLLAEEMEKERKRLNDPEKRWNHREYFSLVERVKSDAWKSLRKEEQEAWRDKAREESEVGQEMFDALSP
jgi:hypothetical protein